MSLIPDLDKSDFTLAGVIVDIFDGHFSVVFNPALATEDVVDARCHFVPFVVVPKPGEDTHTCTNTLLSPLSLDDIMLSITYTDAN